MTVRWHRYLTTRGWVVDFDRFCITLADDVARDFMKQRPDIAFVESDVPVRKTKHTNC